MPAGSQAVSVRAYVENPFRGPTPLQEGDPIFGRDREIRLLLSQLLSDRLVLLHSLSGCGKTSLVEAGLRPKLRKDFVLYPRLSVKRSEGESTRGYTMLAKLASGIAPDLLPNQNQPPDGARIVACLRSRLSNGPNDRLTRAPERGAPPFNFLFFDQFEEALTDKNVKEQERIDFFKALGLILEEPTTWVIFAIREDYLGGLQPYLRFLPTQLSSRFRLTQLSEDDAKTAIEMKAEDGRIAFTVGAASSLANNLAKTESAAMPANIVEPVHLQVVCDYLWRHKNHPVTEGDLGDLGAKLTSVTMALGDYYADIVSALSGGDQDVEFKIRDWFDKKLIDKREEQRLRLRVSRDSEELTEEQLNIVKNKYLIRDDQPAAPTTDRVVELAHDRLIVPIIQNNAVWFKTFEQSWLETAAEWSKAPTSPRLLLCGSKLLDARRWAERNEGKLQQYHRNFLAASVEQEKNQRRMRRLSKIAAISTATAVLAISLALFAITKASEETLSANQAYQVANRASMQAALERMQTVQMNAEVVQRLDQARVEAAQAAQAVVHAQAEAARSKAEAEQSKAAAEQSKAQAAQSKAVAEHDRWLAQQSVVEAAKNVSDSDDKSSALQALTSARETRDLNEALVALQRAAEVGDLALDAGNRPENLLQRASSLVHQRLSRGLLLDTLCIPGYVQTFALVSGGGVKTLKAIGEDGTLYDAVRRRSPRSEACDTEPSTNKRVQLPTASAIAENVSTAAFGTRGGKIEIAFGKKRTSRVDSYHEVAALRLSADGRYLASAALWNVNVWRLEDSKNVMVLRVPGSPYSPANWLRWWSVMMRSKNPITQTIALHVDEEHAGDARVGVLAVALKDGCIKILPVNREPFHGTKNMLSLRCDKIDPGDSHPAVTAEFNHDGSVLATGTQDGRVELWNLAGNPKTWRKGTIENTHIVLSSWTSPPDEKCGGHVTSLAFISNKSDMLAVGCQDGTVHIFDIDQLTFPAPEHFDQLEVLQGRIGSVNILSFDPEAKVLYSAGTDPNIEEWRVPTKAEFKLRKQLRDQLQALHEDAGKHKQIAELNDRISNILACIKESTKETTTTGTCKLE